MGLPVCICDCSSCHYTIFPQERSEADREPGSGRTRGRAAKSQKVIQAFASIFFILPFVVSGIDHRFGWSYVPIPLIIVGDVLVALGLYFVFLVFRENTFTSATIEVKDEQRVISTGPYAWIRHPMYAGAFIMLLGIPLALGSWWAYIFILLLFVAIVWRLLEEEKFLANNLPGYTSYRQKVRYRLIPFIW